MSSTTTSESRLPLTPARASRPRWATGLMLATILAAGGVIGASLTVMLRPERERPRPAPPTTYEELYEQQMKGLVAELKLTDEQKPAVRKAVVQVYGPARKELMERMGPMMARAYQALGSEVFKVLTPEQKKAWAAYIERRMSWVTMDPMLRKTAGQPTASPADALSLPLSYEEMIERQMERIISTVRLTKEQEPLVRKALEGVYGPARQQMMKTVGPMMLATYDVLDAEVLKVLTSEQKPAWEKYLQRRKAMVTMEPATRPGAGAASAPAAP